MNPRHVIVNFQHITAQKALENIVKQCGLDAVLTALMEDKEPIVEIGNDGEEAPKIHLSTDSYEYVTTKTGATWQTRKR